MVSAFWYAFVRYYTLTCLPLTFALPSLWVLWIPHWFYLFICFSLLYVYIPWGGPVGWGAKAGRQQIRDGMEFSFKVMLLFFSSFFFPYFCTINGSGQRKRNLSFNAKSGRWFVQLHATPGIGADFRLDLNSMLHGKIWPFIFFLLCFVFILLSFGLDCKTYTQALPKTPDVSAKSNINMRLPCIDLSLILTKVFAIHNPIKGSFFIIHKKKG